MSKSEPMLDTKAIYKDQLNKTVFLGSNQAQEVSRILAQIESNKKLNDDDRLELETHSRTITTTTTTTIENTETPRKKKAFPKLEFEDVLDIESGLIKYGFNEHCDNIHIAYAEWLIQQYLPIFHPMPNADHQYPIAACFALLNCKAVLSKKQSIPIPYFVGMNGSGKTELAKSIAQHYPRHLWTEIRPNNTGASIRDTLDNLFSNGEPGLALFDNFHPRTSLDRLGSHYDIILANNEESSISRICSSSNDNGKSEFRTHCFKVFTSIFDLSLQAGEEFGEIARRCIVLQFKEGKPLDSRVIYDWEGQQRIYQRIWGQEFIDNGRQEYGKILGTIARINPVSIPIGSKLWNICQVPIAVGVYCKIFSSIPEGMAHFARHFDWLKNTNSTAVGTSLAIVLKKYVKEELPRLEEEFKNNPYASKVNACLINSFTQDSITKYIQAKTGFSVSQRQLDEIIQLLNNLGYSYTKINHAMGFVKE